MNVVRLAASRLVFVAATLAVSSVVTSPAYAGSIPLGDWLQFSFTTAGVAAAGCDPADPAGSFCIPSSGTPSSFLDAPAWTFTSALATTLSVTDAFLSGDRFSILDFDVPIQLTSAPTAGVDCGDDPAVCLATPGMSKAVLQLAAGSHSLTIVPTVTDGGGSGFLRVDAVPEPSTFALMAAGFVLVISVAHTRREVRK
jgi:hypothetical protein